MKYGIWNGMTKRFAFGIARTPRAEHGEHSVRPRLTQRVIGDIA